MPYKQFTKIMKDQKKWCIKNIRTGKIVCYSSPAKRQTGIRMREMFAHGFKPTKRSRVFNPQYDLETGRMMQPKVWRRTRIKPKSGHYSKKVRRRGYVRRIKKRW